MNKKIIFITLLFIIFLSLPIYCVLENIHENNNKMEFNNQSDCSECEKSVP